MTDEFPMSYGILVLKRSVYY